MKALLATAGSFFMNINKMFVGIRKRKGFYLNIHI